MGVVGSLPEEIDVVVIGGGPAGYPAAIRAAELGKSVAIVEADKLGGACLNYTCIPTSVMTNIADKFYEAGKLDAFGISSSPTIDFKKAHEFRMNVSKKPRPPETITEKHNDKIEKIPLTPVRKAIAKNMETSWTIPRASHIDLIDASALNDIVSKNKDKFLKQFNVKLTFLPF